MTRHLEARSAPDVENTFRSIVREWRSGATIDPAKAFSDFPELEENRSIALDLLFEAHCLVPFTA